MSPIRNLSDRSAALPTIGELRKGGPKIQREKNGKAYETVGKDLGESFRFTSDDPRVVAAFVRIYGSEPTEIPCILAGATADEAFEAWQEEFSASGLKHRCDGLNVVYELQQDGTAKRWPIGEGPECKYLGMTGTDRPRDACKAGGRLKIILLHPDPSGNLRVANVRRIGQVLVLTTSKNDIRAIAEALNWYERIHGNLTGVPFMLRRKPVEISTPTENGQRRRMKKWLIDLTPSPEWVTAKLEGMRQRAFAAVPGAIAALPAPPGAAIEYPDIREPLDDDDDEPVASIPDIYSAAFERADRDNETAHRGSRAVDTATGEIREAADDVAPGADGWETPEPPATGPVHPELSELLDMREAGMVPGDMDFRIRNFVAEIAAVDAAMAKRMAMPRVDAAPAQQLDWLIERREKWAVSPRNPNRVAG